MTAKKTTIKVLALILSIVVIFAMMAVLIFYNKADKLTESNTTLCSATVVGWQTTRVNNGDIIKIVLQTEEYEAYFVITEYIAKNINTDFVEDLTEQSISFRIQNNMTDRVDQGKSIDMVSLESETEEIFSLEDYNKYIHDSLNPLRIACVVIAVLFLAVAVFCAVSMRNTGRRGPDTDVTSSDG